MQLTTTPASPALGVTAMDIPAPSALDAAPPTGSRGGAAPADPALTKLLRAPTAELVQGARTAIDAAADVAITPGSSPKLVAAVTGAGRSLQQASMLVQLVNRSARDANISPELELNLMNSATGLAAATARIGPAAAAATAATTVGELVSEPISNARAALDVVLDHVQRTERTDGTPGGYL